MWNFQGVVFIWTQAYRKIFKSALVYLQTIRRLLPTNCLSVFDHFASLVRKGPINITNMQAQWIHDWYTEPCFLIPLIEDNELTAFQCCTFFTDIRMGLLCSDSRVSLYNKNKLTLPTNSMPYCHGKKMKAVEVRKLNLKRFSIITCATFLQIESRSCDCSKYHVSVYPNTKIESCPEIF